MPSDLRFARLWCGGEPDYLDLLTLSSLSGVGAETTLFAYEEVGNLPPWVNLADAAEIMSQADAPAPLLADAFRWRLLAARPGVVWAGPGMLLRRAPELRDGRLIVRESPRFISPDLIALPPDSPALAALLDFIADPTPVPPWASEAEQDALEDAPVPAAEQAWGVWGARALTWFLEQTGEAGEALPPEATHPISLGETDRLLARKQTLAKLGADGALAVNLPLDRLRRALENAPGGLPKYWSPLGGLLRDAGIDPRAAPLAVESTKRDDGRWTKKPDAGEESPLAPAAPQPAPAPPQRKAAPAGRVLIVTCMKNEGPFILEWIAYHRSIGVTDFLVYTNDCNDGTDTMLDLLAEKGVVAERRDNPFQEGDNPQKAALLDAQTRPVAQQANWIIPMDVDEFINIRAGDGRFQDMLDAVPDADMISMTWRLFGAGFVKEYEDRFVTEQFRLAAPAFCPKPAVAWGFKTAFRNTGFVSQFGIHRPLEFVEDRIPEVKWVDSCGRDMPATFFEKGWRADMRTYGYSLVSLNHYALRSAESYLVKRDRGRVNTGANRSGLDYWFRMNHNVVLDQSILPRLPAAKAEMDRLLADGDIAEMHARTVAHHRAKIAELHGEPEFADLYRTTGLKRMNMLSRLTHHFGNQIYNVGPAAVPLDFIERAEADFIAVRNEKIKETVTPGDPAFATWLDDTSEEAQGGPSALPPAEAGPPDDAPRVRKVDDGAKGAAPKPERDGSKSGPVSSGMSTGGSPIFLGENDRMAYAELEARAAERYPMLVPPAEPPRSEAFTVVTAMKNEGPFILEWIAYHLSIGVTKFLVYTNDCADTTVAMLDRLAVMGFVVRRDNPFDPASGQKPQRAALNDAVEQPEVLEADWYAVIDVDEFINIHVGDGKLSTLVAAMNHPNVISLTWRLFGGGDDPAYRDEWLTQRLTRCAPRFMPRPRLGWGFKSMVRPSAPFGKIGVHRPLDMDRARVSEIRWVNGSGRIMPERSMLGNTWFSRKASLGYGMATLNHYVLRTAESYLVKRDRGRINHVDQDQGFDYWKNRDYCTEIDDSIHVRLPRAKAVHAELMKDPTLARLHAEAVAWHRGRIDALMADENYRALFDTITAKDRRDAVYVATREDDDDDSE